MEIGAITKGLETAEKVAGVIHGLIKGSRGTRRAVLLELKENIQLIFLYLEGGAPIDKVIAKLESTAYRTALLSGFNFNTLKRGKVKAATTDEQAQLRPYIGWSTEQLLESIYLKVKNLKDIVEIDSGNEKYRKSVRLNNIFKLMLLLLKHIGS